jgi:hypothetical protein
MVADELDIVISYSPDSKLNVGIIKSSVVLIGLIGSLLISESAF